MAGDAVVHVVDDDESVRTALGRLFCSVGLEVRSYGSAQDFITAPRPDSPGCIVLDVRLPGMSGIHFQAQLANLGIRLPVVLMTGHGDIPMSVRAMKAGAIDFLSKPFRDQDMLDAVAAAIDRDRKRRSADAAAAELRDLFATLSPREQQVMTPGDRRQDEQAGGRRPGDKRDYRQNPSRRRDAQNGGPNGRGPRTNGGIPESSRRLNGWALTRAYDFRGTPFLRKFLRLMLRPRKDFAWRRDY